MLLVQLKDPPETQLVFHFNKVLVSFTHVRHCSLSQYRYERSSCKYSLWFSVTQ